MKYLHFLKGSFLNRQLLWTNTDIVIPHMINRWDLQKMLHLVVTFFANSLVLFFNLLLSKYVLKILATFLTSFRAKKKYEYCVKSRVYFLIPVATFFKLALLLHACKKSIKLLRCFWKLFCIIPVISIYRIKTPQFFMALSQPFPKPS